MSGAGEGSGGGFGVDGGRHGSGCWLSEVITAEEFRRALPLDAGDGGDVPTAAPGARRLCDVRGRRGRHRDAWLVQRADALPLARLREAVATAADAIEIGGRFHLLAGDPDAVIARLARVPWPGEFVSAEERDADSDSLRFRPLRHYFELFRLFPFRLTTPRLRPGGLLAFTAVREAPEGSVHGRPAADIEEAYGAGSTYRRFDRLEEPEILDDLLHGVARLGLRSGDRLLALGINDGRELDLLALSDIDGVEVWGVDASVSAIEVARSRWPEHAPRLLCADLVHGLSGLDLPCFDAVWMLGLLQSRRLDRNVLLRSLRAHTHAGTRTLISLPACHLGASDITRRPIHRADPRSDRGPLIRDLRALTRHFYRAGARRVECFGSYDLFLVALP